MIHTYVIVPVADITQEMIDSAIQDNFSTLRKSINELNAVLKFDGDLACFNSHTKYTHEEILVIMSGEAWTPKEPE
jgi:hypothetical protein